MSDDFLSSSEVSIVAQFIESSSESSSNSSSAKKNQQPTPSNRDKASDQDLKDIPRG